MRTGLAVLVICCAAAVAHAQQGPSKQFLDEYQKGIDAYRLGKYDEAKTHLEAAKAMDPTLPGPYRWLAALAQTEQDWPGCVAAAREALRLNPSSAESDSTRKLHDACRTSWGKPAFTGTFDPGQGAIAVTSDQPGATIQVNGLAYGATPLAPRVAPAGDATVTVALPGYLTAEQKVTILAGIVTDVEFTLAPDPNAHHDTIVPTAPTVGWIKVETTVPSAKILIDGKDGKLDAQGRYEIEAGSHTVDVSAPGHEPMQKTVHVTLGQLVTVTADLRDQATLDQSRKTGTMIFSGGVGLVVVGAVTALLSMHATDQARDEYAIEISRPTTIPLSQSEMVQPLHTRADIDALESRAHTYAIVSNVTYAAAAVAIAVGAYYLVKGRPAMPGMEVRW